MRTPIPRGSQGLFLLGFGFLVWSFAILSCNRGGGGSDAAAAFQATVDHRMHVSTTVAMTPLPPGPAAGLPIRTLVFTAGAPTDILEKVLVEGTVLGPVGMCTVTVVLQDGAGIPIQTMAQPVAAGGVPVPFRILVGLNGSTMTGYTYPAATYTVVITAAVDGAFVVGSIDGLRVKFFTGENVTVTDPSGQVAG